MQAALGEPHTPSGVPNGRQMRAVAHVLCSTEAPSLWLVLNNSPRMSTGPQWVIRSTGEVPSTSTQTRTGKITSMVFPSFVLEHVRWELVRLKGKSKHVLPCHVLPSHAVGIEEQFAQLNSFRLNKNKCPGLPCISTGKQNIMHYYIVTLYDWPCQVL